MINLKKIFIALLFIYGFLRSQEIPSWFFESDINQMISDTSLFYVSNNVFKPFRFEYLLKKNVTNLNTSQYRIGTEAILSNKEDAHSLYAYFNYRFKKNYYIYSYSRIVKKPSYFEGFSGNVQETKRFGFEAGETDLAGIGFENENFVVQFEEEGKTGVRVMA